MSNPQTDYAALAAAATWEGLAVSAKGMEALREKRLAERAEPAASEENDPQPAPPSGAKPA